MATPKQITAIKDIVENRGKAISRAMIDAGYDETTAKNPKNLTESKAWSELVDEQLPDEAAFRAHREALEATKVISAKILVKGADSQTDDFIDVPDHAIRLKAAELQYKLKGKLSDKLQMDGVLEVKVTRG